MILRSPVSGQRLRPDGPHALTDGHQRWPIVDGIAFLRAGRERLASAALERLDAGDKTGALVLLLADQDEWWRGPAATPRALTALVERRQTLTLREAMELLSWGPVSLYFAHRWSDPTFLAGLALTEAHWTQPADAFELACGIGHHLGALAAHGVSVAGADVVFAKLWIARHWIVPDADLVCFDAARPWPIENARFDLVTCHDAFYFLEPKHEIAGRLRALAEGPLLIGHVHNRDWPNFSAGSAMTIGEIAALFPDACLYDDAELALAALDRRSPRRVPATLLPDAEAFALAENAGSGRSVEGLLVLPPDGIALRRNPLYDESGRLVWPSERYEREYAPRATYRVRTDCPAAAASGQAVAHWALCRELLDLPDRW